jgi:Tol biopolymer transport system component
VLSLRDVDGELRFPAVSPDGKSLAYAMCKGMMCDISIVSLGPDCAPAGESNRLTYQAALILGIAWAADGGSLIYGSWLGGMNLWRVPTAGGEPQRLELGTAAIRPAVSPKGNSLAYARFGTDPDIWKFEGGAGPIPIASSTLLDFHAQLSPDGERIVFGTERSGRGREIWVANADGSRPVRLTEPTGRWQGAPRWSPDGRWIAYDAQMQDGSSTIRVVDAAGGSPRQATPYDGNLPSWSRDGKSIYFRSGRSGRPEVWRVSASGGEPVRVTDGGGGGAWESWDGTTLYYNRGNSLYSKPLAGGPETLVLESVQSWHFFPTKDGIYYADRIEGTRHSYEIRFLNFASRRSAALYRFESLGLGQGLSVSPDQKTILFSGISPSKSDDLMLIQNFH